MQEYKTGQNKKYQNEFHFQYSYTSLTSNFTRNDTAPEELLRIFY